MECAKERDEYGFSVDGDDKVEMNYSDGEVVTGVSDSGEIPGLMSSCDDELPGLETDSDDEMPPLDDIPCKKRRGVMVCTNYCML